MRDKNDRMNSEDNLLLQFKIRLYTGPRGVEVVENEGYFFALNLSISITEAYF
jgi:hypothetical protein